MATKGAYFLTALEAVDRNVLMLYIPVNCNIITNIIVIIAIVIAMITITTELHLLGLEFFSRIVLNKLVDILLPRNLHTFLSLMHSVINKDSSH